MHCGNRHEEKNLIFTKRFPTFLAVITLCVVGSALPVPAQQVQDLSSRNPDPKIRAALQEISPEQVRSDIEKLVSFKTRSTISAQDAASIAAGHGVGAAREWIKSEFERYSRDCGGCLDVKTDSFTQPVRERVATPTVMTNVYAVLKGTNSEDAKWTVVVTGHYDSRNSSNENVTDAAPGANDDGSGTAISLECARVLSKLKFPGTIIFLTVAGEEQGLYGSKHFAEYAKWKGWDIEAALNNDIVGGDRSAGQNPKVVRVFSESIPDRSEEHTSELQSPCNLVCRLLLEKKKGNEWDTDDGRQKGDYVAGAECSASQDCASVL